MPDADTLVIRQVTPAEAERAIRTQLWIPSSPVRWETAQWLPTGFTAARCVIDLADASFSVAQSRDAGRGPDHGMERVGIDGRPAKWIPADGDVFVLEGGPTSSAWAVRGTTCIAVEADHRFDEIHASADVLRQLRPRTAWQ